MNFPEHFAVGFVDEMSKIAFGLLPNLMKNPPKAPMTPAGQQVGLKLPGMPKKDKNPAPLPAFPQAVQAP